MVKNTKGGSGHKSQARKFVSPKASSKTRLATEEGEVYAFVMNKSGGENCIVMCQDEVSRRCVIRGKFRSSRGKRDNFIAKGTWVLVGIREWTSSEKQVCDLLEVYNENDKIKLKTVPNVNWTKFISHDLECSSRDGSSAMQDDSFEFSNSTVEEEYQKIMESSKSRMTLQTISESSTATTDNIMKGDDDGEEKEGEIDIDDI
jgi:translation initiation factor IF-1